MNVSTLIAELERVRKDHPDLDVHFASLGGEWVITTVTIGGAKIPAVHTGSIIGDHLFQRDRIVLGCESIDQGTA